MAVRRLISRRGFAALASGLSTRRLLGAGKIPVGVQLFCVRDQCAADLPGTLNEIANIGYEGVEFAGYHGRSASELRQLVDQYGLKCCGSHLPIENFLGDKLASTIEFNRALGNRNLIVPGLPNQYTNSRAAWLKTAQLFHELAQKLEPTGMRIGYHNHAMEFQPVDGELPWDTLFSHTGPEVIIQLDLGNAGFGGADPVALLERYPGRVKSVHAKDFKPGKPDVLVGEGNVRWPELFNKCETIAGTEWYIVEHESPNEPGLLGIRENRRRLRRLGR